MDRQTKANGRPELMGRKVRSGAGAVWCIKDGHFRTATSRCSKPAAAKAMERYLAKKRPSPNARFAR